MVIVEYQGIGKSTLAIKSKQYIDLESSSFWYTDEGGNSLRWPNWYDIYCNIAEHLSQQGYDVFVSSHEPVRKRLQHSNELVVAVCPAIELSKEWIDKLHKRYLDTELEKDFKSWQNAVCRYSENIEEILIDCKTIIIHDMNYNLEELIENYKNIMEEYNGILMDTI